jgi:hypothetical protein
MMLMDYDVMLLPIYVLKDNIDKFPLHVQDT